MKADKVLVDSLPLIIVVKVSPCFKVLFLQISSFSLPQAATGATTAATGTGTGGVTATQPGTGATTQVSGVTTIAPGTAGTTQPTGATTGAAPGVTTAVSGISGTATTGAAGVTTAATVSPSFWQSNYK